PCECNGNLDPTAPRSCDPVTGACLKCLEGYGGTTCETCDDGFYGDAITLKNCHSKQGCGVRAWVRMYVCVCVCGVVCVCLCVCVCQCCVRAPMLCTCAKPDIFQVITA